MEALLRLGKHPPKHDPRTLQLAKYTFALPPAPVSVRWSPKIVTWPMYGNDTIGDCTCAAVGHMVQAWTANGQAHEADITEQSVISAYSAIAGYKPGDESTDNGANELDVMKYWRTHGIGGHKIGAFADVAPLNETLIKQAVFLFGGLYIGVELPRSAQRQAIWDVPRGGTRGDGEPNSWGGHSVNIVDYDATGLTCVTWGALKHMTWRFFEAYCDEAHAIISQDFFAGGKAPNGFALGALETDLKSF